MFSEELKIKANLFNADQKTGISVFEGDVNIIKGSDELNASKVTIYTDSEQVPTKFIAEGNTSFYIKTLEGSAYRGKAGKVIYLPNKKEYYFFKSVHLIQINEKKEIIGEEVVLKTMFVSQGDQVTTGEILVVMEVVSGATQPLKNKKEEEK